MLSHIGDNIGYKKNAELCNRNLNNKHMAKDAEIEQVLSLPNEEWQRKKLRLPHSQKREVEKPQKRRSREPTLFKDYRRFCQSESTFMGAKQRFVGANAAIVTFAPTIPCFAQRNL